MSYKLSILKDTAVSTSSSLIVQGISFVLAIYIRRFLGPYAFGIWVLVQTYLTYIAYTNLGMFGAVYRQIPVLRGQGRESEISGIKNAAFAYVSISSLVVAIVLVSGICLFQNYFSDEMFFGLLTLALLNILQRVNNYQIYILYTEKRFIFVSKFRVYSAVVNAILCVMLIWFYGLYWLYIATVVSYFYNVYYIWRSGGVELQWQWNGRLVKELMAFGLPLLVLTALTKLFYTYDRILIVKFLGVEAVGIYSLAVMMSTYISMIPNQFFIVLFPRTLEKFGEQNDGGKIKYSLLPTYVASLYFSFLIGVCWIFSSP